MNEKWYDRNGNDSEISVSTRVRLARNLREYPFTSRLNSTQAAAVVDRVEAAMKESSFGEDYSLIRLDKENRALAVSLAERHLISPEFAVSENIHGVLLSKDESVSIMINEEDHLRIQVLGPGLCPEDCLKTALEIDSALDSKLPYAFDENLGYLTHCPTNLGTGLRGSVMLHLPALTESGDIRTMIAAAGKLGFVVRGIYGEGTSASGSFYQISNQMTLGFTEEDLIGRISDTVSRIMSQETALRAKIYEQNTRAVEDRIWRSVGILTSARLISSSEATGLLSMLRLGIAQKIVDILPLEKIDRLIWEIQPGNLELRSTGVLASHERDYLRAEFIRSRLGDMKI